jgi:hypothetical protein
MPAWYTKGLNERPPDLVQQIDIYGMYEKRTAGARRELLVVTFVSQRSVEFGVLFHVPRHVAFGLPVHSSSTSQSNNTCFGQPMRSQRELL